MQSAIVSRRPSSWLFGPQMSVGNKNFVRSSLYFGVVFVSYGGVFGYGGHVGVGLVCLGVDFVIGFGVGFCIDFVTGSKVGLENGLGIVIERLLSIEISTISSFSGICSDVFSLNSPIPGYFSSTNFSKSSVSTGFSHFWCKLLTAK